jgi:prepilin-type N-terminal cleavage/methylation domain-containing protein
MKTDRRAGFTLIEMLAGLFVTGLFILVAMPFVTQLVGRAWSGEGNMATADEWMRADARLTSDLGEAVPLSRGSGNNTLVFTATPTRVEFVRPSITGDRSRLELVTLAIETDSNGDSLVRRARPYGGQSSDDDDDDDGASSNIRLLSTPCSLRFTIPGGLSDEDAPMKELPRAIMLEVENCERLPDIPFVFPIPARSNPVLAASTTQQH